MNKKVIPIHANSYDSLSFVHTQCVSVYKKVGYTPLQVVQDIKPFLFPGEATRCTYVGRLDPMAEGWMHVLWSGDMTEKDGLLALQKTYEIDVVFGVSTDTGDVLGLITGEKNKNITTIEIENVLKDFIGPFTYPYPTYSSPHMKKTLKGEGQVVRKQKGHIYSIDIISTALITSEVASHKVDNMLALVRMPGDFRLNIIQDSWKKFFKKDNKESFSHVTLRVVCGSGTYMRTLAEELGKKFDVAACTFSIRRIGIHTR